MQLQGVIFPNLAAINNNAGMSGMGERAKVIDLGPLFRSFSFFLLTGGSLFLVLPARRVKEVRRFVIKMARFVIK
jgi:hypothetical protein